MEGQGEALAQLGDEGLAEMALPPRNWNAQKVQPRQRYVDIYTIQGADNKLGQFLSQDI